MRSMPGKFLRFIPGLLLLAAASVACAHPGWGLQVTLDGRVYFTDLDHVWVLGDTRVAERWVSDVHAHALYLDDEENLIGDHSGVDDQGIFHTAYWLVTPEGERRSLPAFEAAAHFGMTTDDGARLLPVSDLHKGQAQVLRLSPDGKTEVVGGGAFGSVDGPLREARFGAFGAVISNGQGGLLLTSGGQLRAITGQGRVTTLLGTDAGFPLVTDRRSPLLGLSLAFNGDVFVADIDERHVIRFDRDSRRPVTVLNSDLGWTITGVQVEGSYVYLLEYNRLPWSDAVRVRRMDSNGKIELLGGPP
ncbi:MAG: hypothetical protein R3200_10245 [Xanthomonadales bacterium]|nr:hypothetical protein [Xanthomonadales bacterium]